MKKKYLLASTPIILGFLCFIISGIIGSNVAPDGTLNEPFFFLIPIGYLFITSGIISLTITAITSKFLKK
ncbi:DUF3955 domain-containing protein [Metaclostridioides mangenotii]|uniref:DUF3955 domain-containing protein n=1 Tax=Metaclostridioides mangenotii TaxID=1540 RepID=UPI0028F0DE8D|nr:DUF3955 domain-containing protein [Clostridioides mangenotii]